MLGSKNWEDNFDVLLHLVKEFKVAVWEVRKTKIIIMMMTHTHAHLCPHRNVWCQVVFYRFTRTVLFYQQFNITMLYRGYGFLSVHFLTQSVFFGYMS